jgi:FkbM family methyltransferase
MTSLKEAFYKFCKHPSDNFCKVLPYLKGLCNLKRREFFEKAGLDYFSKPYNGHDDLLKHINSEGGFFVQCGGFDGVAFDPTYYLEKFKGWRGVIVEPIPKMVRACITNRTNSKVIETALVSHSFSGSTIELINCNMMSVTPHTEYDIEQWTKEGENTQNIKSKKIIVKARTLDDVLQDIEIPKINLLVIDVEGSEAEVLGGFSLNKYQPDYLLIEISNDRLMNKILSIVSKDYNLVTKISYSDFLFKDKRVCHD